MQHIPFICLTASKAKKGEDHVLLPPDSYHVESMSNTFFVDLLEYVPAQDKVIGPLVAFDDRKTDTYYLVAQVRQGELPSTSRYLSKLR